MRLVEQCSQRRAPIVQPDDHGHVQNQHHQGGAAGGGDEIGFGIDGDEEIADRDFTAVRGTLQDNKFTAGLENEMEQIAEKAGRLRKMLGKI